MTNLIPAAPGWYLVSHIDGSRHLDPIIAWSPAADLDGGAVLLPYVNGGHGFPPEIADLKSFKQLGRSVVYFPNYDPEEAGEHR
ncbi:hypothetical protein [Streptomyces sp. AC512_CC834]|uniref:hypothetical protein n=1 Tax=Streptomyces sp. AC512_CC834 TaxID=2823691 RepID=UPI001C27D58C|nr:hypothetical protein [Streptomyces sp. AC512_CC834]